MLNALPPELLSDILEYLDIKHRLQTRCVSKFVNNVILTMSHKVLVDTEVYHHNKKNKTTSVIYLRKWSNRYKYIIRTSKSITMELLIKYCRARFPPCLMNIIHIIFDKVVVGKNKLVNLKCFQLHHFCDALKPPNTNVLTKHFKFRLCHAIKSGHHLLVFSDKWVFYTKKTGIVSFSFLPQFLFNIITVKLPKGLEQIYIPHARVHVEWYP